MARLHRVARTDNPADFVLLRVTGATDPLQLTVHATDGESAFELQLNYNGVADAKTSHFDGSTADLNAVVAHLLLRTPISNPELVRGLGLVASVQAKRHVELVVRRNIGGITQRQAAFKIPQSDIEISLFDWAGDGCATTVTISDELRTQEALVEKHGATIVKLQQQLESLTAMKKEHEETLLLKFKDLLNSKKTKIRELNRALDAAATIEGAEDVAEKDKGKEKAEESEAPKARGGRRKAAAAPKPRPRPAPKAPARTTRKRKPATPPSAPSSSESEPEFEPMDAEPKPTTRATRATRGGAARGKAAAAAKSQTPPPLPSSAPASLNGSATASEESDDEPQQQDTDRTADSEDELPPPRPPPAAFMKKSATAAPSAATSSAAASTEPSATTQAASGGAESEDDEL